jgi:hypothetical protein
MKIEDRLKKAQRKLEEHQLMCKKCDEKLYDVTIGECSIAYKLQSDIDKIKKQMRFK